MNGAFKRCQGCADRHEEAGALVHSQRLHLAEWLQTTFLLSPRSSISAHGHSTGSDQPVEGDFHRQLAGHTQPCTRQLRILLTVPVCRRVHSTARLSSENSNHLPDDSARSRKLSGLLEATVLLRLSVDHVTGRKQRASTMWRTTCNSKLRADSVTARLCTGGKS